MTRPAPRPTPLAVRILDLLQQEFGAPLPGSQVDDLRAAVSKLIGMAAQQSAMRELIAHDEGEWTRIRDMPVPERPNRKGH